MADTPLYDQMSALLTYANGITGVGDTHLGDAVRSLADGYGGGGGPNIARGTVTNPSTNTIIQHNLNSRFYLLISTINDLPTSGTANNAVSLFGIVNIDKAFRMQDTYIQTAYRYNASTGAYTRSATGNSAASTGVNSCAIGISYTPHQGTWSWVAVDLSGIIE